ncbi:MAG: 16S rRNA (cytidine(1402)-2'-O)-methyltransferase [Armatimonadetes bacterium]|nr:16S rRNA (cytidine(1402)-2'-O)-methyltransferase [Armatimonadota bacterium]
MGKLTLVGTPIGNLGDLSPRAKEALSEAELWIVEDTRVSGRLQSHLGLKVPMKVLNEHTQPHQADRLFKEALTKQCCLLTDAGMPAISDPGAELVDFYRNHSGEVDAIPGPSAVTTALALSGFYAQRYCFLGFLPRKHGPMLEILKPFADSTFTVVLFESPNRLLSLLGVVHEAMGERRYAICREISKLHQQVFREKLPTIPTEETVPLRGEFTIVVEGLRRRERQLG